MPEPIPACGCDSRTFEPDRLQSRRPPSGAYSLLRKVYSRVTELSADRKGAPSPPVDFPENEAHKLLKTNENRPKNRPKRS